MSEKKRWKTWADDLRQEMMTSLTPEVTKSVDDIISETETSKGETIVRSKRFWQACQAGNGANDSLLKAGFEIEFQQDAARNVREVTLRLNHTWMTILQRVLDRNRA